MSNLQFTFNHLLNFRSREHLLRMDDEARNELLRDLLKQKQSETTWRAICELFTAWPEGEEKAKALFGADQALDAWDDKLRHLTSSWGPLYDDSELTSLVRLVRSLRIYHREERGSVELWAIAHSQYVQNLRYLTVVRSEFSSPAIRSLSNSPHLANLLHLEFRRTFLSGEGIEYLFQAKGLPNLRTLKLIEVGLKHDELHSIGKSIPFSKLGEIDFSENLVKSEGLSIISQSPWLSSIKKLELRNNHIRDDGISAFAKSPYINSLRLLDLSDNPVTEVGQRALRELANRNGFSLII